MGAWSYKTDVSSSVQNCVIMDGYVLYIMLASFNRSLDYFFFLNFVNLREIILAPSRKQNAFTNLAHLVNLTQI